MTLLDKTAVEESPSKTKRLFKKQSKVKKNHWIEWKKSIRKNWELYLLLAPVILYFLIFHYYPLYGLQIAFKDFIATKGITGSPWVGFKHFERFFDSYYFWRLIKNTIGIGVFTLLVSFPVPIIIALLLNEVKSLRFKKFVQTIIYAPHFLSTVVVVGMLLLFLKSDGMINQVITLFGGTPIDFISEPAWFKSIYVLSDVWQTMGWSSIIYIAALSAVDPAQHEAAMMDGASKFQRIIHINIPAIMPTIVILFILNVGSVMAIGFEKVFLLQNDLNMSTSDVISTFVYRSGILEAQYSFSAAVGLFNSIINFILLIMVNRIAKKVSDTSLW
ncbi:ABC transporter permease [Lysinibacillus xylanilyticus]|uniref:ABC transporter permease subunit n=1 Tax=Lysinibacillus xylanilyticus TaxID=582475 RepID=A0ABT4ERT4_9BACI|nr:ABC transporter permease subunit [Lysinibacillus xylanilyticus]MCY9548385.1 ABC transporter permease subunit [Lysinibacillus xylanilyticus]